MSSVGRGRGYTGRHQVRPEQRPGDDTALEEDTRILTDLSPRALAGHQQPEPSKMDPKDLKKQERPPEIQDNEIKYGHLSPDDEESLKELLTVDETYRPLLVLLEQFSPGEDGIQFNRKLRQFETTVNNLCPDEARLNAAFSSFRAVALTSCSASRRLAAVGASFTRQQRQQALRTTLLNVVMQGTYSKLDILEKANPQFLINAVNLMGDYFAEARLCNGNKVHILASPLLQYMKALLVSNDIRAHRSLATQLMQNGRELLSILSQELDDLSISIRIRLLSPPPVSIIWLLLSSDLCLNKFLPLPNTLQQFYASHLDLSQEDGTSYSEVTYGSWKKSEEKKEDVAEKVSQMNLSQDEDGRPKLRPILGAGAGLLRQEHSLNVSQENFDTWAPKPLAKRYDLNSWRQTGDEKEEEPVFNPTVLPPPIANSFPAVPDYPPPRFPSFPPETFPNYLQQGDGAYIQGVFPEIAPFPAQGDGNFVPGQQAFVQTVERQNSVPEKVNSETQNSTSNRRPVENWRKEKPEPVKDDARKKNWTRQQSRDNIDEVTDEKASTDKNFRNSRPNSREVRVGNRRNSTENADQGLKARRNVTEVPRSQKYWDHDDRCDIDY